MISPLHRVFAFIGILAAGLGVVRAEEATTIRLGHFSNITHAQAVYAQATGELEKRLGVRVEWSVFNAGPSAIEALFADAIDATYIGPNPAINGYLKSRGEALRIIAGAASGGAALVVRDDAGITSLKDFDGKIIATPQMGNTQDVAARAWFEARGYRLKEKGGTLTILPLSNPDQLLLFLKGEIAGAWTVEPWISRLEIEGKGRVFFEEKTLWPDGKYITTHLIAGKKFLERNPRLVKKLIQAHVDLTQRINANKKAAAIILNKEIGREIGKPFPEQILQSAMDRLEFTWDPIRASLQKSAEDAHRAGFLRDPPRLEGIYDLKLLNEVLQEKGLPSVP